MKPDFEQEIIDSWCKNVRPWVRAIEHNEIASRTVATNRAILDILFKHKPATLLDVGCGEGWLIRACSNAGIACLGVDAVPDFAESVQRSGGRFKLLAYENFYAAELNEKFDIVVCNFSLLGKASVEQVIIQVANVLNEAGCFIIQTLHPQENSQSDDDKDGWREGSWHGFSDGFVDPAPWYFRSMVSWEKLFEHAGFRISKLYEPVHPESGKKLSVIFELILDKKQ